jgi:hypothetical protein
MSTSSKSPERGLQPSDILKLNHEIHVSHDGTTMESRASSPSMLGRSESITDRAMKPTGSYLVPQKRSRQAEKPTEVPAVSDSRAKHTARVTPEQMRHKEKVIGGLSREQQLAKIWADFDKEERREKYRHADTAEQNEVSGNEVLGAWEDVVLLPDISTDEGVWGKSVWEYRGAYCS